MICEDCKEKRCIDTTCRTCWPKDDKSDRAEYIALMSGDLKELKPVRNYIDSKGMFDNALIQHGENK